ncbi:UNVERIFIED_CONTAM: ABC transporter G family member 24 [Sesamum calycinum]|uniref:ABC transporter G family member 24 n=1 Tax=Sesamum calycinum TaxID=2727403 RepID=A0AAW2LTP8_9LAMI
MMMMMRVLACFLIFMQAIITMVQFVQCQQIPDDGDYNGVNTTQLNDPAVLNVVTEMVYLRLSGVTSQLIHSQIADRASFCVTNPDDDRNRSFNYSDNLSFLSNCILTTRGDLPQRVCTAAELKFYFTNFIAKANSPATFLKPNRNCNITKWLSGCEPGWACSAGLTHPVDFTDSHEIPARTSDCQPCCEGFFCPQGLTCMIPVE